jgi:hypothetical protein
MLLQSSIKRRVCLVSLLAAFLLPAARAGACAVNEEAAFRTAPDLDRGFHLMYEQKFSEGRELFQAWRNCNPEDPLGPAAIAASYLFEEFYRQGVLSSEFFLDDKKFLRGIDGHPDAQRMRDFRQAREEAIRLAEKRLVAAHEDPQALFALTLAAGMEADALSILERKQIDSLHQIKESDNLAKRLLAQRPDAADAWLALGAANYIVGSLPGTTRFLLWFGGIHGDRQLGMEQLGKTAASGRYLRPYAKIMLALAARREKDDALARKLLGELVKEYPSSPLFAAENAKVASIPIRGGLPQREGSR